MASLQQLTLWEYHIAGNNKLLAVKNGLGPYRVQAPEEVCRHLRCANYDGCLSYAATMRWPSFSCQGCRKASHGTFVQEGS